LTGSETRMARITRAIFVLGISPIVLESDASEPPTRSVLLGLQSARLPNVKLVKLSGLRPSGVVGGRKVGSRKLPLSSGSGARPVNAVAQAGCLSDGSL